MPFAFGGPRLRGLVGKGLRLNKKSHPQWMAHLVLVSMGSVALRCLSSPSPGVGEQADATGAEEDKCGGFGHTNGVDDQLVNH